MFCPKCGSEIAEGSAFCGKCGAPVVAQSGGAAAGGSAQGAATGGAGAGAPPVAAPCALPPASLGCTPASPNPFVTHPATITTATTAGGSAQGAATGGAGAGAPAPKRSGAKIGVIAAVAVVAVVIVAGFVTNGFGLAGVQPKEAVEVSAASQGADEAQDANAADGQAAGTGESVGNAQGAGDGAEGDSQDAVGTAVKSAVEAYTWDELSQISAEIGAAGDETAAIEVAKRYNLCTPEGKLDGTQVKLVTLADGAETYVQIVGFAHDDKTEGGKAGITFIFGNSLASASMNETNTTAGGWKESQLRAMLNSDVLSCLPDDLASVIVPVDKLTNNVGQTKEASSVTKTSDKLWLFSPVELVGPVQTGDLASVDNCQGSEYKLFSDMGAANAMSTSAIGTEAAALWTRYDVDDWSDNYWWERSPVADSLYSFHVVGNVGPYRFLGAEEPVGVVPGFCI
ncbi:DUF6273 domain-containing protein [Adlercreutzia sp. R21]|uniref:DUF6273 domain-containing protein n=1 Tax=Adlercreutzia wanghongyangiae TaxID=3111451 RepID=UPI002DB86B3E|nr:DUF6273 domain-containing protein [Adlercreutzia sp. R21]MEC4184974.1 DUF6273 domain-containing protein [Adlercreutzia sp. R21]